MLLGFLVISDQKDIRMNRLQVRETIRNLLNDIENSDLAHNWPDDMVNSFIQEAINEIAQRTLCNKDSITEEYCRIPVEADVIHYPFPEGVIDIQSVRRSWDGRELKPTSHSVISNTMPLWETATIEPTKFLTDYSSGYLSVVGKLSAPTTETFNLTVHRMPAVMTTDADELDIPVRFHTYTYNWIMYRCLQKLGGAETTSTSPQKLYGVEMSQRFLVAFEGNPSQLGYGGDIGKIMRMLNNFNVPRYNNQF